MADETKAPPAAPPPAVDWKQALPEELRGVEALKDFKDPAALAKAYVDTKAYVGGSIRPPGPDASEADRDAFRAKLKEKVPGLLDLPKDEAAREALLLEHLGTPGKADGYQSLADLKVEVPEGVKVDETALREHAAKLGYTRRQYKAFVSAQIDAQYAGVKAAQAAQAALKKELGAAYDDRLTSAAAVAQKLGASAEQVAAIKAGAAPVDTVKIFLTAAKALGTQPNDLSVESSPATSLTPSEARAQIQDILRNPDYHNAGARTHDDLVAKMLKLHGYLYNNQS